MEKEIVAERLADMANWQHTHGIEDNVRHEENIQKFDMITATLHELKTNHLRHIQDDTEELQAKSTQMQTDIWWIKWLIMGFVGGIGAIIVSVIAGGIIYLLTIH